MPPAQLFLLARTEDLGGKKKKKKSGNPFWFNFEKVIEMSRAFFFFLILVLIQADSSFKNVLEFGCYEVQWETFLSSAKLPLFNF